MVSGIVHPISNDLKWGGNIKLHYIGAKRLHDMRDIRIIQVANLTQNTRRDNPNRNRVYDTNGLAPCVYDYSGGVISNL